MPNTATEQDVTVLQPVQTVCPLILSENSTIAALAKSALTDFGAEDIFTLQTLPSISSKPDDGINCAGFILLESDLSQELFDKISAWSEKEAVLIYLIEDSASTETENDYLASGSILSRSSHIDARLKRSGALRVWDLKFMLRVLSIALSARISGEMKTAVFADNAVLAIALKKACRKHHLLIDRFETAGITELSSKIRKANQNGFTHYLVAHLENDINSELDESISSIREDGSFCLEMSTHSDSENRYRLSLDETETAVELFKLISDLRYVKQYFPPESTSHCKIPSTVLDQHLVDEDIGFVPETVLKKALSEYSIPVIDEQEVKIYSATLNAAVDLGYPLVMKILAPEIQKREELGAVVLNIADEDDLRRVWQQFNSDFSAYNYVLQRMVPAGLELIIEARRNDVLGPVISFGPAGAYTSIYRDTAVLACPASENELKQALESMSCYPLFQGEITGVEINIDTITSILVNISNFISCNPTVKALRIDPLIGNGDQFTVVDAKAFVRTE